MNCSCIDNTSVSSLNCPCDFFAFPDKLKIPAGLQNIHRQLASFPGFRRAMLSALKKHDALSFWKARDKDDMGIMLLEMWAYICDSLSFYDEVIAHEAYLRTSKLRPSIRRQVGLLGYLPRPAIAAEVILSAFAEGKHELILPAGIAFRSGAFDNEPPQVFELEKETIIHPFFNNWAIKPPYTETINRKNPAYIIVRPQTEIKRDTLLFIHDSADEQNQVRKVYGTESYQRGENEFYTKVNFEYPAILKEGTPLSKLNLMTPAQVAVVKPQLPKSLTNIVKLDKIYPGIKPDDFVLMTLQSDYRWFKILKVSEVQRTYRDEGSITINGVIYNTAGIEVPVTQIMLDDDINSKDRRENGAEDWKEEVMDQVSLYFDLRSAGTIVEEEKLFLTPTDRIAFEGKTEKPLNGFIPTAFILEDKNDTVVRIQGSLKFDSNELIKDANGLKSSLSLPVKAYGNLLYASHGESVTDEILGSGDAAMSNQSFKLRKNPLSYFIKPTEDNPDGLINALTIYVNGIKWKEVATLFNVAKDKEVYIVRQNDDGDSIITFGDGINGARLPSGNNNLIAHYRYGAGASCPPPGIINQLAKPVKDLRSVRNPDAAYGGDDVESSENMVANAGRYALLLGRAVSLIDIETVVANTPSVKSAKALWEWDTEKQLPAIKIWYIGDLSLIETIRKKLKSYTLPTTPITIATAEGVASTLTVVYDNDPRYLSEDIEREILDRLIGEKHGILLPENTGIGRPIYRSVIIDEILSVPGVRAVHTIELDHNHTMVARKTRKKYERLYPGEIIDYCIYGFKPEESGQYFYFGHDSFVLIPENNG